MTKQQTDREPPHSKPLSIRGLAREVGRSETAVRKWIKRQDWPFGRGPFDVAQVRSWMAIHLDRDPAQKYHDAQRGISPRPISEIERARTMNFEEAGRIRRLKREELEGKLHNVEECAARRRALVMAVRSTLTRTLPRALATELVGRSRGDMESVLRSRLTAVCNRFSEGYVGR